MAAGPSLLTPMPSAKNQDSQRFLLPLAEAPSPPQQKNMAQALTAPPAASTAETQQLLPTEQLLPCQTQGRDVSELCTTLPQTFLWEHPGAAPSTNSAATKRDLGITLQSHHNRFRHLLPALGLHKYIFLSASFLFVFLLLNLLCSPHLERAVGLTRGWRGGWLLWMMLGREGLLGLAGCLAQTFGPETN